MPPPGLYFARLSIGADFGRLRRAGGLTFLAALCVAAMLPANGSAAVGSIAGTVTNAGTGVEIPGIEVCAYPFEAVGEPRCAVTGLDGTYLIGGLPPDEYEVEFRSNDYVTQYYDGHLSFSEADPDPVPVGSSPVSGIDAVMSRGGVIEGTVITAAGLVPLEGVDVCAWRVDTGPGELVRCRRSDAEGNYALPKLQTGDYKIEFFPNGTGFNLGFQYYDHSAFWSNADLVPVTFDANTPGIDAELGPGAEITGTVFGNGDLPVRGVIVCPLESPHAEVLIFNCVNTSSAGRYRVFGLPSGSYKVVFSPDFKQLLGQALFEGENDGYPTQYYNGQSTLTAADVLGLPLGGSVDGIDAHLAPSLPPAARPPTTVRKLPIRKPRRCRHGTRRKKIHGKVRCVRAHSHRHKHRRGHRHADSSPARRSAELLRLLRR